MSERNFEAPTEDDDAGVEGARAGTSFLGEFDERAGGDTSFSGEFGEREQPARGNESREAPGDVPID